eukprot:TRINITY_DN19902_c0_g1_i1.p2 TRINITY_DN19902_c0_g1~~TRINITY_DN19902_c0_g1_i1.p2  ORF type:complete len:135 (-),score=19.27 TRINITY_DN19902_c0_g1_i1:234-599(-)
MGFAMNAARFARCRSAHLCPWARQVNANLSLHRSLAAAPLLRLAAEPQPLAGFAEQLPAVNGPSTNMQLSDDTEDTDENSAAIAAIISGVSELDITFNSLLAEMLDLSLYGSSGGGVPSRY